MTDVKENSRIIALRDQLTLLAADLSGFDESDLSPTQTFLELGFDSLFLTQLASLYQKEFNHKITFRQLINDQPTIGAMAKYLDEQLPEQALADTLPPEAQPSDPAPSQLQTNEADEATNALAPAKDSVAPPLRGPRGPVSDKLAAILAEQLAVMAEQLEMLRDMRSSAGARSQSSPAQAASVAPMSGPSSAVAERAVKQGKKDKQTNHQPAVPAGFGPDVSAAGEKKSLTPQQRAHLERLIARYNARTAGSKAATQRDRACHADPRTAAGFNPLWKEMVYPIVVKKSHGAYLWDIDDNQYIDILNGFGPNFFGHCAPFIANALKAQLEDGYELGPQTPRAGDAARLLCELTGMDRVSWVNTGSEAVQAAIRISRTVTGRDKIVVFKGDYHGNFDEVLVRSVVRASGARTLPLAPGIPLNSVDNVIVLDYGETSAIEAIRASADEIAAVLVEPVQSRRPEFQPREFLHELRALTKEKEIVLVFDEVITGFRICPGGAQEYFGVEADMATYGKIIGGGMPIGVVAGRSKFMDTFDGGMWQYGDNSKPTAGVTFFAGTFVRHPLAIAAAHASLEYLKTAGPALQEGVNRITARLATTLNTFFEERGVKFHVAHFASQMFIRNQEESNLATLFFYHLRARGIHVLEDFPSYVTAAHTDEDIDAIIAAAKDTIYEMQADGVLAPPPAGTTTSTGWRRTFPLTDGQRAMWFAAKMEPLASCAFNESDSIVIDGALDEEKFSAAVIDTLSNHEAFALRFDEDGVSQFVDQDAIFDVERVDFAGMRESERSAALNAYLAAIAKTPFDLEHGPLVRALLVRMGENKRVFVIYCHHLVFDGFSAGIVIKEIAERYRAQCAGAPADIAPTTPYSVYALQADRSDKDPDYQTALAYWKGVFHDGVPALLDLPVDRPRDNKLSVRGATIHRAIDPTQLDKLKSCAKTIGVSLNALLFSAYSTLLGRLSAQEDFVIGAPSAGQSAVSVNTVGYCVNILPIRTRPVLEQSFDDFAKISQATFIDALENQEASFGALVHALKAPREENRLAITETVFNYSRYFADLKLPGCKIAARENRRVAVYHDLFFNIIETERQLNIYWDYCTELYNAETINQWIDAYIGILNDVCENPKRLIGDLPSTPARVSIARNFVDGATAPGDAAALGYEAFEKVAQQTPDKTAAVCAGRKFTYREIKQRSDRIAFALARQGAKPGDFVGVLLDRSADLISAVFGVWKAGCAYLPLDPEYPDDRLRYMVEDSGAQVIIAETEDHVLSAGDHRVTTIAMQSCLDPGAQFDRITLPARVSAAAPAYVMYTSGSTGDPKGVVNTHRAVVNFLKSMARTPGLSASDCLLAVTTLSFDISILELLLPVCVGAQVVIATNDDAIDGFALTELIGEYNVSVVQGTLATWRLLLDAELQDARAIKALCGGEPMTPALVDLLLPKVGELWNMYGPTETTVWSTCAKIERADKITVGRPIDNTVIYVVDRLGRATLPGVSGEIWIGGDGVANGYFGKPELTAEKFITDPFSDGDGARVYKTGDWGRLRPSGDLEILGRRDNQVKIRGYRIELGEIESSLERHEAVAQAAVMIRKDRAGDDLLAAYVVYSGGVAPTASELRQWMRQKLPHYMIPQLFVELNSMPLTNNNKIDRNALPEPAGLQSSRPPPIAPRTDEERDVAQIWMEILHTDEISVTDNFFELGGQSLQVAQMAARVRKELGYKIPPQSVVFETLEQLVARREEVTAPVV